MPAEGLPLAEDILRFWFEDCRPWQWFRSNSEFDRSVSERFGGLAEAAQDQKLIDWEVNQTSSLALVLLLDQFSRQIWRDQARAFQGDLRAQPVSYTHLTLPTILLV